MPTIQRFAQKGLVFDQTRSKILVIRYLKSKYLATKLVNKYGLPGGQIEFGEQPDEAMIKEVREETGIIVKPLQPFYIWTWMYQKDNSQKQIIAVARICVYASGAIKAPEGEQETTLDRAEWLDLNTLNIKAFVEDEKPVVRNFLIYARKNPFLF